MPMIYNLTVIYRDSIHGNPGHKYAIWASCCSLRGGAKLRVIEKHPGPLNTSLYWDEACLVSEVGRGEAIVIEGSENRRRALWEQELRLRCWDAAETQLYEKMKTRVNLSKYDIIHLENMYGQSTWV